MNLLPSDSARWSLNNSTLAGTNLTISANGTAGFFMSGNELSNVTPGLQFSCSMNPITPRYVQQVYCTITLQYSDLTVVRHTLLITHNRNTYCFIPFTINTADLLSFGVTFYSSINVVLSSIGLYTVATADNSAIIDQILDELPVILEEYNTYDVTVPHNVETAVAFITAQLHDTTDLSASFSCTGVATDETYVFIRFYDDQTKCLFAPIIYHLMPGAFTMTVPYAYLNVLEGFHNFYVTLQTTTGALSVDTRGIFFIINGGSLATRLVDAPADVNALAFSQDAGAKVPKAIFMASLSYNVASFRQAVYTDGVEFNWETSLTLSGIKEVAIECDGEWVPLETGCFMQTQEKPKIIYIDLDDNLFIRDYSLESVPLLLAENVVSVTALRSWQYVDESVNNDAGFIVAYIKGDGLAYYRSLVASYMLPPTWETEAQLPFTLGAAPFTAIHASRANDFRTLITIEDSLGEAYALITKRYYQGDSVPSVYIAVSFVPALNLAEPVYPEIVDAWNESNTEFFISFNMPVDSPVENLQSYFTLRDYANKSYAVYSTAPVLDENNGIVGVKLVVQNIYMFTEEDSAPMTLSFTNPSGNDYDGPIWVANQNSRFSVPSKSITFEAKEYTPKVKAYNGTDDHITVGFMPSITLIGSQDYTGYNNENIPVEFVPTITFTQIFPSDYFTDENLTLSFMPSVTLVHVGTDPL